MTARICEGCGAVDPAAPQQEAGRGEPWMCGECSPETWTFTASDPGLSGLPAFWINAGAYDWAIAISREDDELASLRFERDGDMDAVSERQHPMAGDWRLTALKTALDLICRANGLPAIPPAQLADLFMAEGW